ncbi:MAG TPA: response regulator [Polyangia bacterium]|nr:response regulator [Polyangia bacterium]
MIGRSAHTDASARAGLHRGIVVVVDDDDDIRTTLEEFLEDTGYLVLTSRDGAEALTRMRGISGRAVAIVDLMMPNLDGWDLIAAMRADRNLSRIPVVVISARGHAPVRGANVVMPKPLVPSQLLAILNDLCP